MPTVLVLLRDVTVLLKNHAWILAALSHLHLLFSSMRPKSLDKSRLFKVAKKLEFYACLIGNASSKWVERLSTLALELELEIDSRQQMWSSFNSDLKKQTRGPLIQEL